MCASYLSSDDNYLRQLNNVGADRVEHILQLVYDRYEGLHRVRCNFLTCQSNFLYRPAHGNKVIQCPSAKLLASVWICKVQLRTPLNHGSLSFNGIPSNGLKVSDCLSRNYFA